MGGRLLLRPRRGGAAVCERRARQLSQGNGWAGATLRATRASRPPLRGTTRAARPPLRAPRPPRPPLRASPAAWPPLRGTTSAPRPSLRASPASTGPPRRASSRARLAPDPTRRA